MRRYVIDIDFSHEHIVQHIETFEQKFYPTFFHQKTVNGHHLGYGSKEQEFCEFLDITIDEQQKSVTIERDLKATLVLFYYYKDGRLIISSDYNYFAQQFDLKKIVDENYIKLFLGNGRDTKGSICKDISILYPRKKYHFHKDELVIEEVTYTASSIQLEDILTQNFSNLNQHSKVGAEISGGKDSAFLPILAKKSNFSPFLFVSGQLHSGKIGEQQRSTLSKVVDFLDIPYEYHHISDDDYPFKNEPVGVIKHPIEEIYKKSVLGEIAMFKKHGINTVFTGFGGDEMFESAENPDDFIQIDDAPLRFIFQKDFIDEVQKLNVSDYVYHDGLFPTSLYDALISRNNFYIHEGIRPITPYLNLDAYKYFQSLNVSKTHFFTTFYNNFDPKLEGAFDRNTNMNEYFAGFFKSEYFNNLLQSSLDQPSSIHSYYNIENIKKHFGYTPKCQDELINEYDFFLYKFVAISLMLK